MPVTSDVIAPDEVVEAESEHSGDELQEAHAPAMGASAQIRSERFGALRRRASPPIVLIPQCSGEAFFMLAAGDFAGERFAVDDGCKYATFGPQPLECLDLRIGPPGFSGRRGAKNHEESGHGERRADLVAEIAGGW
jgi:hypothetical protein